MSETFSVFHQQQHRNVRYNVVHDCHDKVQHDADNSLKINKRNNR